MSDKTFEHELDYVFVGFYEGIFNLNPNEVSETRYISLVDLQKEILSNPDNFTEWFKIILNKYLEFLK